MKNADIIVVGAGIIGLSTAWQLHRRGVKRILVLEKGAGIGEGSTGASSAVCRHRYSADPMIRLARTGIDAYRDWREFTGLKAPKAAFQNDRVLWLTGGDDGWAEREHARLGELGIATDVLDRQALAEAFPAINSCTAPVSLDNPDAHVCSSVDAHHLLELDGGYMDPVNAATDLLDACRNAGIIVRFGARVEDVSEVGGRIAGVSLDSGEVFSAAVVVNAAGPWCQSLYESLGLVPPMPLVPVRIQVVHLERNPELVGPLPVCVDMANGIYFRTQNLGQQLIVSSVREEDERERVADPDDFLRVADDQFRDEKLHLLQHRLPALEIRSIRDYCGLYTVNETDVHPLIGPMGPAGFFVANGLSGHGFKAAPAIGAVLARQITGHKLAGEDDQDDNWLLPDRTPIRVDTRSVLA